MRILVVQREVLNFAIDELGERMRYEIVPFAEEHLDAVVALSLNAWAPVFESIRDAMDPEVYDAFYPDWRVCQAEAVTEVCQSADTHTWVALQGGAPVGFTSVKVHPDYGEIYMIAVDPGAQRSGIGLALSEYATNWMKEAGVSIAMVETGGDPGHGPARRTYEKAGFRLLPVARYFKKL
jgi:ribosomal protein S18 acetylase RimI-like enzyme